MASAISGAGLGLRIPHIAHVLTQRPDIPWFEVHICNFLQGGLNRHLLQRVADFYPLSFHGVSANLGGVEPLDEQYMKQLRALVDELQPGMISEHLCFTAMAETNYHDLLPIPFTESGLAHFVERVDQFQSRLNRSVLIENVSRYTQYTHADMSEAEFLAELCARTGCGILLDLNNAYVNQRNLGEDIQLFLQQIPLNHIGEIHLAGYSEIDGVLVDTHSQKVHKPVWEVFEQFYQQSMDIPCLIEWDSDLPDFDILCEECGKASAIMSKTQQVSFG